MSLLVADYSYLSTFAECARKGQLRYVEGWTPKEDSASLHAGRCLHIGIGWLLETKFTDLDGAVEKLREAWGDFKPNPLSRQAHLTLGHCEGILRNYHDDWKEREISTPLKIHASMINSDAYALEQMWVDEDGNLAVAESPLAVRWGSIIYGGLIDYPNQVGELYYVDDIKCTSQWVTDNWAHQYGRSFQLKGYLGMMQLLTGIPFAGVRIRGVFMGKEALDDDSKWSKRTSSRSAIFGPYTFSQKSIEETFEWAEQQLKLVEWYKEHGYYPMNDRACKMCEFASVCHANPAARIQELRRNFTKKDLTGVLASGADS